MRFTNKNVSRKAAAIALASALTIFGGAGAALAYWTTTGSGSGTVTSTASETQYVVTQSHIDSADLYPGGPAAPFTVHVVNPNSFAVVVHGVTSTIADNTNFTVVSPSTSDVSLAPGASADFTGGSLQMNETGANQDSLKGSTVTITHVAH